MISVGAVAAVRVALPGSQRTRVHQQTRGSNKLVDIQNLEATIVVR